MEQYSLWAELDPAIDDVANSLSLRSDLHTTFDKGKKFVITPKNSTWAVHFLEPTWDFGNLYHNIPLQLDPTISPIFLLVRFAWAIIPRLGAFLKTNPSKLVKVRVSGVNGMSIENKRLTQSELISLLDPTRSRTPRPIKKQKLGVSDQGGPEVEEESQEKINQYRGRKRLRVSEEDLQMTSERSASIRGSLSECTGSITSQASLIEVADASQKAPSDLKAYKRRLLLAQRPKDPHLLCCDYNAAEKAHREGLRGPEENGGALLCLECLGLEYRDDSP